MPARTCPIPQCPLIIPDGHKYRDDCAKCTERKKTEANWSRGGKRLTFYSSARWQKVRKYVLAMQPLCAACNQALACEVDHIISATHDKPELWYDIDNLQGLCRPCHNLKTLEASKKSRNII